jgi:ABC-type glycerol-3-phosphate transport system substrate-binding protein
MRTPTKLVSTAAIALLATGALAACGGSSSSSEATAAASPAASAIASEATTIVGDDPATWAPIMVKKKTKTIEMIPRQIAVFPAYEYAKNGNFTAVSSDPAVVEILPADNSTVVGFRAIAPGTAVVKVYDDAVENGGKKIKKVTITVNPS